MTHNTPWGNDAPSYADSSRDRVSFPLDDLAVNSRWILQRFRSLIGKPPDAPVTRDEIAALTTSDFMTVKGVGPLRAERALNTLRGLVSLEPLQQDLQLARRPLELPNEVSETDVVLANVDPRYEWILRNALGVRNSELRANVPRAVVANLRLNDFQRVPGVGPIRAERAFAYFQTLVAQQPPRQVADVQPIRCLHSLPSSEELPTLLRDALAHVRIPIRLIPGPLQAALFSQNTTATERHVDLGSIMALTATHLTLGAGFTPNEAHDLISLRDALVNASALRRCIEAGEHRDVVLATALTQLAIHAQWGFQDWFHDAGIAPDNLLALLDAAKSYSGPPLDERLAVYCVDLTVARRVLSGESLKQVGDAYGVTRERIRQRVARVGITGRLVRESQRHERALTKRKYQPLVEAYVRSHPGCSYREITEATKCPIDDVERLSRVVKRLILDACDEEGSSEESLSTILETRCRAVSALQRAAIFSFPLSSKAYAGLLRDKYVEGPSAVRVIQVFGTWRNACDAAGVESGHTGTLPGHSAVWSVDDVLHSVCSFLLDDDFAGTSNQYDEWRIRPNANRHLPSFGTVKKVLGHSWAGIRRRALLSMRQRWTERGQA